MKKQSRYNIWVDKILYNSFSDKAIQLEEDEVDAFKYYLNNLNLFEENYLGIFKKCEKFGFIIDEKFDELDFIFYRNKYETFFNRDYHLTINPTLECNYKCWYCCVEDQETKYENRRMDDTTINAVKKHLDYMFEKEHITKLHLDWFGGEPLMYFKEVVYPISKHALQLAKKYDIPFSNHITTNAYYINDDMISAFNEINITSLQIPIDGNERKHNAIKNINGQGHYKQIITSINKICKRIENVLITLRINYDLQTLSSVTSIIDDIDKNSLNHILVDFQRVWQIPMNVDASGNNERLVSAKKQFIEAGFQVRYFAYYLKRYRCCYADRYYHRVINYDGKIFKCTARDYADELSIGSLSENGSINFNETIMSKLFSDTTFNNEQCLNCNKLPLCYGTCIQKHYETKIGESSFHCSHDFSEISLKEYIQEKVHIQQ